MFREPQTSLERFVEGQVKRRSTFDEYYDAGLLPKPDEEESRVEFDKVGGSGDGELSHQFIRLHNPGKHAVDLSGWFIDGVDAGLPAGSVLGVGSCAVIVNDDSGYMSFSGGGELMLGTFGQPLDPAGGAVSLRRPDGSVSAWTNYDLMADSGDNERCSGGN